MADEEKQPNVDEDGYIYVDNGNENKDSDDIDDIEIVKDSDEREEQKTPEEQPEETAEEPMENADEEEAAPEFDEKVEKTEEDVEAEMEEEGKQETIEEAEAVGEKPVKKQKPKPKPKPKIKPKHKPIKILPIRKEKPKIIKAKPKPHKEKPEPKEHSHKKKNNKIYWIVGILVVLGIALIILIILNSNKNNGVITPIPTVPANIQLVAIKNKLCNDCFDIKSVVAYLNKGNNVTSSKEVDYSDAEAKALIEKYNITKIPTVIVTGEINKINSTGFAKVDDALIFTMLSPPYTDAATGITKGRVSLTAITKKECTNCTNLTLFIKEIKSIAKVSDESYFDAGDAEAKLLINKYNITKLPTVILSNDAGLYAKIAQAWAQLGTIEQDGNYVLRIMSPPYWDLTQNKIRGLVDVTYITVKNCSACYNVTTHKLVLLKLGMALQNEKYVDITDTEGKILLQKYNITLVPTIIITGDLEPYTSFPQIWAQVGTVEKDGAYVFRNTASMGPFFNTATNETVTKIGTQT